MSLQLYSNSHSNWPTALAVKVTTKTHPHLIKLPLADLRLRRELGVSVLLIKRANGTFEKFPGAETKIMTGDWMCFGVPQGEGFSNAVDGLEARLKGDATVATARSS